MICPIHMRPRVLDELGALLAAHHVTGVVVVTNETIGPLYAPRVRESLVRANLAHRVVTLPDGEDYKTLESVSGLYDMFLIADLERAGAVVALGGGVVGDTAGYAAATYLRGVNFVQAPTTLLAMVDSSIGGKTGVNLPQGKNLVGAFVRPLFAVADTDTLRTLPPFEVRNGVAEMVKAAIIGDAQLFAEFERGIDPLEPEVIRRAAEVKQAIVAEDPGERGRRSLLNLGHTFGHALEQVSGYTLAHGQGVAIGTALAARLAAARRLCAPQLPERIASLLATLGLPVGHSYDPDAVLAAMAADKKRRAGRLRFVLPRALGDVVLVDDVPVEAVRAVLSND